MHQLWQDVRYGIRMLAKDRGFTAIAVLTLALGIGANTAIFSVVDSVLLKRLPYPDPARLVILNEKQVKLGDISVSWKNFEDWQTQQRSFSSLAAMHTDALTLTGAGPAGLVHAAQFTPSLFSMLGVTLRLGHLLTAADDAADAAPVVVLAESFWRGRFGGDPGILGKSLILDGTSYTVIGIAPSNFKYFSHAQIFLPITRFSKNRGWQNRENHEGIRCIARLGDGISVRQAQAEMDAIMASLEKQYPNSNAGELATVTPLEEDMFHDSRFALFMLLGAVGLVLLIACANVANLFLARAAARQKEFAIRAALGAGNWRLVRQLLTESVLLSLAGGGLGLLLAYWSIEPLQRFAPQGVPRLGDMQIDFRVLLFTLGVSLATGIFFGLAPALHASRQDLTGSLKETGTSVTSTKSRQRLRAALLVSEMALAIVLVIASGLVVRSILRVFQVNLGANPDHVLALDVYLSGPKYKEIPNRLNFYYQTVARVRQLAGVNSASWVLCTPFVGSCWGSVYIVGDRPIPPQSELSSSHFNIVDPRYFQTMQISLLDGRFFSESDTAQSPPVVIIDATMAHKWWPHESAIGKRIKQGFPQDHSPYREVVGVVGDVKVDGPDAVQPTEVYEPISQNTDSAMTMMVRTGNDPMTMANSVVGAIHELDADQAVDSVQPLTDYLASSIAWRKSVAVLLGFFGLLALGLAALGIYGVMSYTVSQRSHEIGIRMALGARPGQVLRLIVGQGLRTSLIGVGIGLAAALGLTQLFTSLLFGVTPRDPVTFATVVLIVVGVAVAGSLVPARRAAKVDPMVALRYE